MNKRAKSMRLRWLELRDAERAKYLRLGGVPIRIVVIEIHEPAEPAAEVDWTDIPECMK